MRLDDDVLRQLLRKVDESFLELGQRPVKRCLAHGLHGLKLSACTEASPTFTRQKQTRTIVFERQLATDNGWDVVGPEQE